MTNNTTTQHILTTQLTTLTSLVCGVCDHMVCTLQLSKLMYNMYGRKITIVLKRLYGDHKMMTKQPKNQYDKRLVTFEVLLNLRPTINVKYVGTTIKGR